MRAKVQDSVKYSVERTNSGSDVIHLHNRRQISDRRRNLGFFNWRLLGFRGRRKQGRRQADQLNAFVDHYEPSLLMIVLAILLLSCTDAWITLTLLSHGGVELNPFMDRLINWNPSYFVAIKCTLTGLALTLLVMYHNFKILRRIRVYYLLWVIVAGYGLLIIYELILLQRIPAA